MKVTHVALCITPEAQAAGRPQLTPELLASTGGRYSRNGEGLDAILSLIDWTDPSVSAERILRYADYGHMSLLGLAPVAMFIDGLSIFAAYWLFRECPCGDGQETSTRYCRFGLDGLVPAEELGLQEEQADVWREQMQAAFDAYHAACAFWETRFKADPSLARIPSDLLKAAETDDLARRKVTRLRKNAVFDRARYFIPIAARTNMMLVQSAREWVGLCQKLLSHPLKELRTLGAQIQGELELVTPRLLKHAVPKDYWAAHWQAELERTEAWEDGHPYGTDQPLSARCHSRLWVHEPFQFSHRDHLSEDLTNHPNRYAPVGPDLCRMPVRFSLSALAIAELRDLNRHRTGTKWAPLKPRGFYYALDQMDETSVLSGRLHDEAKIGQALQWKARRRLSNGDPTYVYWMLLGHQLSFEHVTTADKFLYGMELRTGTGAHYRYAEHCRELLAAWYAHYPETRGLVLEGSAEPE